LAGDFLRKLLDLDLAVTVPNPKLNEMARLRGFNRIHPMTSIFIGLLRGGYPASFRWQCLVGIQQIDLRYIGIVHMFQALIDRLVGTFTRDADPNVFVKRQNELR